MSNRGIEGESKVSEQAINGAKYIQQFFENAPDRTFTVERIIGEGSWGFTLQMMMKSSSGPDETSETSSSATLSQAPGLQPLPPVPETSPPISSDRNIDPSLEPAEDLILQASRLSLSGPRRRRRSSTSGASPPKKRMKITRFVMKRSLAEVGEKSITTEIDALDRLRGCMHIAQPSRVLNSSRWNRLIRPLKGPTLLMDWIENGMLWDFYEKRSELDEPLPNRLLWSLFLCLCRIVVGLAWPPRDLGRQVRGRPTLEVIPPLNENGQRPPKSRLLHVMIDKLEPMEHKTIPLLKLIDFGMSRDLPVRANEEADLVVKTNIRAIGEVMLGLLRGNVMGGPGMMDITYNGQPQRINSFATDLDTLSSKYKAPAAIVAKHKDRIDNLDPEIRSLVAACVAVRVEDRPAIEDLLVIVERNAKNKTVDDYKNYKYPNNETDAAIKKIVEETMFNVQSHNIPKLGLPPPQNQGPSSPTSYI
ncbi:hypothetical protein F4859DRAFT_515893 [Xylaria cf. heliscus]|nr:hypothetical protein F4859DRAFT_515893 [Xylaria cf. heliscus]